MLPSCPTAQTEAKFKIQNNNENIQKRDKVMRDRIIELCNSISFKKVSSSIYQNNVAASKPNILTKSPRKRQP